MISMEMAKPTTENFNNDWENTEGFHAFCFDLHTDPEGSFYFAMGCPVRAGGGVGLKEWANSMVR